MMTICWSDSMPSISAQNIGTSVLRIPLVRPARRTPRIDSQLIDEDEGEEAFLGLLAGPGKEFAHLALRFADPHVENFRPFDVP